MRYRFFTADVFTDQKFGGNQLAVIPDAVGMDSATMQSIAREFNFSETVFVFPPENPEHTRRVRIFTPGNEVPFAGHPTVGTAHVLAAIGEIPLSEDSTEIVLEEGVGPVRVTIRSKDKQPVFAELTAAKLPEFGAIPPPPDALASMLSLEPSDILSGSDFPQIASCGLLFLFVPLASLDAVRRARLKLDRWEELLRSCETRDVYVFSYQTEQKESSIHSRMFAPEHGIAEDPATGSAAAALAGYLGIRNSTSHGTLKWIIEQGFEMKRPSILHVEADKKDGMITAVRVGGSTVLFAEGFFEIP